MSLVNSKTAVRAAISCVNRKTVTGFSNAEQKVSETFSSTPNATTYNRVLTAQGTLNSNANTDIDLYSFTDNLGTACTCTKAICAQVTASASTTGGKLRLSPGATNGIDFWLTGTTPKLTLSVGTTGASVHLASGTHETITNTTRNINLNNPGNTAITYEAVFILGD